MLLRQLRSFITVAELENVSLAAKRLHISQPPLSRQMRQLEEELGVHLFERTAKSIRLTPAGKVLLEEARNILRQLDNAVEAVRSEAAGIPKEIRIGYAPSLTLKILPEVLRQLRDRRSDIKIQLVDSSTSDMVEQLQSRELDLALVVYPGKQALQGLHFRELVHYPACAILPVGHRLSDRQTIRINEIQDEPLVGFTKSEYPEFHRWVSEIFEEVKGNPRIQAEYDSVTSLIPAIEVGEGISFGVDGFREMGGDRIVVIPLTLPAPPLRVGAAYHQELNGPILQIIDSASPL